MVSKKEQKLRILVVFKGKECGCRRWYNSRICPEQDRNLQPPYLKGWGR